jgi:uncharacterized protein YyaL (SSP411 family)
MDHDQRMAKWLDELANWLSERLPENEGIFACDCDAQQESDTGAWIHDENRCAAFMRDHMDIVLRTAAKHYQNHNG